MSGAKGSDTCDFFQTLSSVGVEPSDGRLTKKSSFAPISLKGDSLSDKYKSIGSLSLFRINRFPSAS